MSRQAAARAGVGASALRHWLLAVLALAAVVLVSLAAGKYAIAPADLVRELLRPLGARAAADPTVATVVWQVRLPRVLAGLVVGAGLAAAGAAYQALFRNPLVSPDILGVSAGASLGAALGIFLSLPVLLIQALSFACGLLAVALVALAGGAARTRDPTLVLVLAGVAVGAVLAAALSLVKVLADPYDQLPAITYWLLGSLASVTAADLARLVPAMALGLGVLAALRWRMNLVSLGDEEARALGIEVGRVRLAIVLAATLATAAAVSATGAIGWVGLLVPHVARMIVGPDLRRLLPAATLLGGGFLVAVDLLARTAAPIEIPLGILTAAMGAPFFLYLLIRGSRGRR